ncbi:MAG: hypothetical protein Q7R80_05020 [bacterium]|nr:hypothetical protein [bacterium]
MVDAPLTKQYFDTQFDTLLRAVKGGFDHVDGEIGDLKLDVADLKTDVADLKTDVHALKIDMADLKERMRVMEDEVRTLSRNMVTKQYLDAKLDIFIQNQERDSLFKRTLLLALEQAKVLDPTMRAKLEQLIPS